jgi:hypothetical protein
MWVNHLKKCRTVVLLNLLLQKHDNVICSDGVDLVAGPAKKANRIWKVIALA